MNRCSALVVGTEIGGAVVAHSVALYGRLVARRYWSNTAGLQKTQHIAQDMQRERDTTRSAAVPQGIDHARCDPSALDHQRRPGLGCMPMHCSRAQALLRHTACLGVGDGGSVTLGSTLNAHDSHAKVYGATSKPKHERKRSIR